MKWSADGLRLRMRMRMSVRKGKKMEKNGKEGLGV